MLFPFDFDFLALSFWASGNCGLEVVFGRRNYLSKKRGALSGIRSAQHARSAKLLLLFVKRIQSPVVAARVADVLCEVLNKFTRFRVVYTEDDE